MKALPGRLLDRMRSASPGRGDPRDPKSVLEDQWDLIRLVERRSHPAVAGSVLSHPAIAGRIPVGRAEGGWRAGAALEPLRRWDRISERSFRTYQRDANRVRLHRLLDFVHDGDRVLDVGIGFGYVTGILLRERRLAHYCGIDLKRQFLDAVEDMAAANGLDPAPCHLEVKSVLDLDADWMARHRPDVVLLLEVLEHIADPLSALAPLGATMPTESTLVLTVPMLGRLEGVWGHLSVFDRGRIEQLCEAAGLTIHYVEPLYGTWILAAVSPSPRMPDRLRPIAAAAAPPRRIVRELADRLPEQPPPSYSMSQVPIDGWRDYARSEDDPRAVGLVSRLTGIFCEVSAPAGRSMTGGMRLPVYEPALVRIQVSFTNPGDIEEIALAGLDSASEERIAWTWSAGGKRPIHGEPFTHVLRPGKSSPFFRSRPESDRSGVVALDVAVRVRPGGSTCLRVHRVAFLGSDQPGQAPAADGLTAPVPPERSGAGEQA